MKENEYLKSLSERQLAEILYRDHATLKHSASKTVAVRTQSSEQVEKNQPPMIAAPAVMDAFFDHLVQAGMGGERIPCSIYIC